jgi:methyl-accepting chemotaxis protein
MEGGLMEKRQKKTVTLKRYLSTRLFLLQLVLGILVISIAYLGITMITERSINQYEEDLYNNYDQQVKNQVMIVNSALENYLNESNLSEEEIREEAAIFISQMSYGENGNFWINTFDESPIVYENQYVADSVSGATATETDDQTSDTNDESEIAIDLTNKEGEFYTYSYPKPGEDELSPKRGFAIPNERFQWVIGSGNFIDEMEKDVIAYEQDLIATKNEIIFIIIAVIVGIFIMSILLITVIGNRLGKGLEMINSEVKDVSELNLVHSRKELAKKISTYKTEIKDIVENQIKAKKEFKEVIDLIRSNSKIVKEKMNSINQMLNQQIIDNDEIKSATNMISDAMTNQVDIINKTSAEIQELSASIDITVDYAEKLSDLSNEMAQEKENGTIVLETLEEKADQTGSSFKVVEETVSEIKDTAMKISAIVKMIEDISNQTSLLALNASIEASRAGEAGRGFSVVADEIRKLAEDSTKATVEITKSIEAIQNVSNKAVKTIENNGTTVDEIIDSVNQTSNVYYALSNQITELNELNIKIINSMDSMKTNKNAIIVQIDNIVTVSSKSSENVENIDQRMSGQKSKVNAIKDHAKELNEEFGDMENKLERFKTS